MKSSSLNVKFLMGKLKKKLKIKHFGDFKANLKFKDQGQVTRFKTHLRPLYDQ